MKLKSEKHSLTAYKQKIPQPLRKVVVCFLIKEDQVLLAMKKRGCGEGKWNGVGGKPSDGETLEESCVREAQEEIGVTPLKLRKAAIIDFYFPHVPLDQEWNQQVHVFLCEGWEGRPLESEEMRPSWFKLSKIPYDEMWADDRHWLPQVLAGRRLKAEFMFDESEDLIEFDIREETV